MNQLITRYLELLETMTFIEKFSDLSTITKFIFSPEKTKNISENNQFVQFKKNAISVMRHNRNPLFFLN